MRFIKFVLLVLFFLFFMVFFIQNNQILSQTMSLQFSLFIKTWNSVPLPFYFLLLLAFVFGALLSLCYLVAEKIRLHSQLRQCRIQLHHLEQEVTSLRNLPLEDNRGLSPSDPYNEETGQESLLRSI